MFTVADVMTEKPYNLKRSNTLQDAKNLMKEHDIRHLPIVDNDMRLLGLITQRDILAAQDSNLKKSTGQISYTLSTPLERIMNKKVTSISATAGLKESARYMQTQKYGCLPVTLNHKLIGIITDTDFVTVAIHLLEIQEDSILEPIEEFDDL
ncbi:CBS domain-containing protein [Vibrio sp. S11_S32]|uniref:CBS domain-containing protein n=1 Tax=Vibrio sp. S11_S32 TaxID=2720225 RepID=UPI00167FEAEF|nr:CBS domain-containing protein [Vibrio sp. S11_S32]MBD1576693.1 CBS domain-containing protein [Vibrio sp. S11_S32]